MFEFDLITHTLWNLIYWHAAERRGSCYPCERLPPFPLAAVGKKRVLWANECMRFTVQMSFAINLSPFRLTPKSIYLFQSSPNPPFLYLLQNAWERKTFNFEQTKNAWIRLSAWQMWGISLYPQKNETIEFKMGPCPGPYISLKVGKGHSLGIATLGNKEGI